ncbi:MAG: ABC transporter ATP-binding protein [Halieaceae bacterium]|nr:ABC transporter ATP-binding protein [Halieaceae bacterium]
MIKAEKLHKQVKMAESEIQILKGIDLEIKTGESVAIVGASGSGKSTLLAILAGLDLPSHGRVVIDEIDLSSLDEDGRAKFRGDHVGFVFQSFQLLPSLTALENVMLPLELNANQAAAEAASHYLQRVGLEHRFSHYPNQLSGGEQQRVAIARAFATDPDILFADEPTGNLDADKGLVVIDLLFSLNQEEGKTLILVTHETGLAERCERSISLSGGKVVNI